RTGGGEGPTRRLCGGLGLGPGGLVERLMLAQLKADAVDLGLGSLVALEGGDGDAAVNICAGYLFQNVRALFPRGAQEGVEVALGEQHRPAELVEVEPDPGRDLDAGLTLA